MRCFFCVFLLFVFCFFVFPTLLSAQFERIDNVLREIDTQKDPIQLTRLHFELSMLLDSVISGVAYDNGFKVKMEASLAQGTETLGDYFVGKNSLDSAKLFYVRAKDSYERLDSLFNYAQIAMRLGNINLAQDNHIDALRLYQECFEIAEGEAFNSLIPHLYNNLGLLYKQIGDYDDALANFAKSYSLFKKMVMRLIQFTHFLIRHLCKAS